MLRLDTMQLNLHFRLDFGKAEQGCSEGVGHRLMLLHPELAKPAAELSRCLPVPFAWGHTQHGRAFKLRAHDSLDNGASCI